MSQYEIFDNENQEKPSRKATIFYKMLNKKSSEADRTIDVLPKPYQKNSPYNKLADFSEKTKIVCHKSDLSLFLSACKVIIVGDTACGKSSLVNRFTQSKFDEEYKTTIGVDFEVERFTVLDVPYTLQIWDSAGLERFRCIAQSYYRNANVIVLVFDTTRASTLINTASWLRDALRVNQNNEEPLIFLVGTKSDLLDKKSLESMERKALKVAQEMNAEYFTVSSKDGSMINTLFRRFTSLAFENAVQKLITPSDLHKVKNNIANLGVFREEKKNKKFFTCFGSCLKKINI